MSYSYPLLRPDVMRLRVFGSAGDFKIDDLGFQQTRFTGDNWQAGAEVVYRFPVRDGLALTAQAGMAYNHYEVGSSIANASAVAAVRWACATSIQARTSSSVGSDAA